MSRLGRTLFVYIACCCFAPAAEAQTAPAVQLQPNSVMFFMPAPGARAWFGRDFAMVGAHVEPYAATWVSYARAPLVRFRNGAFAAETVAHQLQIDFVTAVSLLGLVEVGAGVPFVPFQNGEGVPPTVLGFGHTAIGGAFGDLRLQVKGAFFTSEYVHLGATALMTFPTGDEQNFAGEQTVTGAARFLATFAFAGDRLLLSLDAGVRLRGPASFATVTFFHELLFGAAIAYEIVKDRLFAGIELSGAASMLFRSLAETPIEGLFGVKLRLGMFVISAGAGTGLTSGVGAPRYRVLLGVGFSPVSPRLGELTAPGADAAR